MKKTARIEAIQKAKAIAPFKKKIIQDDEPYIASNTPSEHNDTALICDTVAGATTPARNDNDNKMSPWVWAAGGVALLAGGAAWAANRNDGKNESIFINHAPEGGDSGGMYPQPGQAVTTTVGVPYQFSEQSFGVFQDIDRELNYELQFSNRLELNA